MEQVTREECVQSVNRIHLRIDDIKESAIRIEESSKRVENCVNEMYKILHGNGKDGMIVKVSLLLEKVGVNRKLVFTVLFALIGISAYLIKQALTQGG